MPKDKKKKTKDNYYQFDDSRKIKDNVLFKRLIKYSRPYYKSFIIVIITVLISSFMMSYLNNLFGKVIDVADIGKLNEIVSENKDFTIMSVIRVLGYDNLPTLTSFESFRIILGLGLIILLFLIGGIGLTYYRGLVLNKVGQRILFDIRNEIFSHIESLSLKEIDKTPVGTFVTRVTNDTNSLSELFSSVLVGLVSQFTTLIFAIVLMLTSSVKLSLIVFTLIPIIFVSTIIFRKLSRSSFRRVTYDNSKLNAFLSENLSGMKITQIFNKEDTKLKEFDELSNRLTNSQKRTVYVFAVFRPFINALYIFSTVLIFYFGGMMFLDGSAGIITSGVLYTFYLHTMNLFNPIQNIAQQYNTLQSAFASAEKIFTIIDTPSSIKIADSPIEITDFRGEIEFRDVWFKYDEEWIIKGMNFHVLPGQVVSFVGPTGAGKTTILSLIGRYYDPQQGEILIDGINIKDYDISSLRRNIGEMLQDVFLFTGSIRENITLRDESISDEELIEACKYVNADKFIDRLENGYDEIVKERGNNYSQGQRQLLSFARTICYKPKMIILDEATSNIDTETEVLIQESLEKIKTIGTTIMVAHRLSTIQHSDVIMFIDDGKIIESGNHQELLKLKGRYYKLYELQFD